MLRALIVSVAALAAVTIAGCGASTSSPAVRPVSANAIGGKPAPPVLPAHRQAGAVYVVDLRDTASVAPSKLQFAADGWLQRISWRGWGAASATGQGTAELRICTPDCVQGHTRAYPVTVRLEAPRSCFGARFYSRSTVSVATVAGQRRLTSFLRDPC